MTEEEILAEFGSELGSDAKAELKKYFYKTNSNYGMIYVRTPDGLGPNNVAGDGSVADLPKNGLLGGLEVTPALP